MNCVARGKRLQFHFSPLFNNKVIIGIPRGDDRALRYNSFNDRSRRTANNGAPETGPPGQPLPSSAQTHGDPHTRGTTQTVQFSSSKNHRRPSLMVYPALVTIQTVSVPCRSTSDLEQGPRSSVTSTLWITSAITGWFNAYLPTHRSRGTLRWINGEPPEVDCESPIASALFRLLWFELSATMSASQSDIMLPMKQRLTNSSQQTSDRLWIQTVK